MTVVVDASVALKWVLEEKGSKQALGLRDRWRESAELVIAPPVFKAEVTNALHERIRRGLLTRHDAVEAVEFLISAVAIREPPGIYGHALGLADDTGLGATHDALYLSLAISEDCEMWTADQGLLGTLRPRFLRLRGLDEVP